MSLANSNAPVNAKLFGQLLVSSSLASLRINLIAPTRPKSERYMGIMGFLTLINWSKIGNNRSPCLNIFEYHAFPSPRPEHSKKMKKQNKFLVEH